MANRATKRKRIFRTSISPLPYEEAGRGSDSPLGASSVVGDTITQGKESSTTQRNVRKGTQMHFLWGMKAGNKLDVELDGEGRPINDGGSDDTRFLGTVAHQHSLNIKQWSIGQLNDKWRQWKHDLKDKNFDYSKSDEANVKVIEAKEPDRVDVDQYLILVRHWLSNKGKKSSETNKANKQEAREAREKAREENPELAEVFGFSDDDNELDNDDYT
ncbi:hypothetical protein ACFE04_020727 [Oxalis oulophora]